MKILSISPFHDSSVAVLNNNVIEYFSKEERLTKKKRDDFPFKSINYVINNIKNIDLILICSPTPNDNSHYFLEKYLKKYFDCDILRFCEHHHLAHASLAFYNSGFKESLTFVIDRNGAKFNNMRESETVFMCSYPNNLIPLYKSYWLENIGENYDVENDKTLNEIKKKYVDCECVADSICNITKVYETATSLIGEHPLENGKTMGLSAYGIDTNFENLFVNNIPISNYFLHGEGNFIKPVLLKNYLNKNLKNSKELNESNYSFYANYAYTVQKQTQEVVLDLIKNYTDKTGIKNVCLTGGYALNVVTNAFLVKNLPNINFYFEPIADDTGNSLGAAMYVYRDKTKDYNIKPIKNTFFNNVNYKFDIKGKTVNTDDIAECLTQGKVVAVYNGMAESGPRSLGNRSILFDARRLDAKTVINKIKKREWYRPFACSILEEYFDDYFYTLGLKKSEFMTMSFDVKNNKIPGVTHVNNSCRVQTVNNDILHLYEVLKSFYLKTNIPVLLNTSFNLAGEPLVDSPEDAINTYERSDIDILWFPEKKIMLSKF